MHPDQNNPSYLRTGSTFIQFEKLLIWRKQIRRDSFFFQLWLWGKYLLLMLIILKCIYFPDVAFAKTPIKIVISPYSAYLDYQNANLKQWGYNAGLYGYLGYGMNHAFEIDANYTFFDIVDQLIFPISMDSSIAIPLDDFTQSDITFIYSNYSIKRWKIRTGVHYLKTDDKSTDGSVVLFVGLHRYVPYFYTIGVNFYNSSYQNANPSLNVLQISPQAGYYFGDYFSYGSFYIDLRVHYISLSDEVGWAQQSFISFRPSLSYFFKKLTLNGYCWFGEQAYAVRNDGFVIYYLPEKYRSGFGASLKMQWNSNLSTFISFSKEVFEELGNSADVFSSTALFSLSWTF